MEDIGRMLLVVGVLLALAGGAIMVVSKVPGLGRLPGDIVIQRDGFSCFFPIVTSILLSIVLTIVLNLLVRVLPK